MYAFADFLNWCNLTDLGYKDPPYTWVRGELRERLDHLVCNRAWLSKFSQSTMVNLPLPSSDHCDLWLRLHHERNRNREHEYFKFLGPWLDHPNFKVQLENAWRPSTSWNENISRLTKNLKVCNRFLVIFLRGKEELLADWKEFGGFLSKAIMIAFVG